MISHDPLKKRKKSGSSSLSTKDASAPDIHCNALQVSQRKRKADLLLLLILLFGDNGAAGFCTSGIKLGTKLELCCYRKVALEMAAAVVGAV